MVRRDWRDARAKVRTERHCRRCGRAPAQAAHVLGRRFDTPKPGRVTLWVNPLDIIPLCAECHGAYDSHEISIMLLLTREERDRAYELDGGSSTRRIQGPRP